MQITRRVRLQLLVQHGVFIALLATLAALAAYLARDYRIQWDVTQNARNSLTRTTLDVLKQLKGPVAITSYATPQDAQRGNIRKALGEFIARYQRAKPDIKLTFIDPREQPKLAAAAGIRVNGEMVIEYERRTEHLADFTEQALTNALMRLARGAERLVMGLEGHGERKLDGIANHDLGEFGRQLAVKGFRTASLNLSLAQEVPANAALIAIASPQVDLLPAEVQKIRRYLEQGGNLLWLIDAEPLRGLQPIAEMLGLVLTPGIVVDPEAVRFNFPAALAIGTGYARHAITANFRLNTVFPFARQIATTEASGWRVTPIVEVAPRGWLETGKLDGRITFDKGRDQPGPVIVAAALERTLDDKAQRVVVVGTGHFLANTYLGNAGNLDLGVNIVNWLAGDDNLITIQPRPAADSGLALDRAALYLIAFSFLIALPLLFVATGAAIWWRRRRI
ncbi:MAG: GldG family protein [Betaproteobacteria bacterium]|nr:GldG family protein [Betaproteobacteria bacterium]